MKRKGLQKIALLFGLEAKVNRDRFSGILRFAATKQNWELRTYTFEDIAAVVNSAVTDRKAVWLPDGIILVGYHNAYSDFRDFCQRLAHRKIPCVVIDGEMQKMGHIRSSGEILTDDNAIGSTAADYFIKKGFTSFACIGTRDMSELGHSRIRLKAYADRLTANGYGCAAIPLIDTPSGKSLSITEIAARLKSLKAPCAVLAYSDEVARYVLDACRYADIAVPEHLSVLGVDDQTEITENTRPTLSSILPDFEGSGFCAAEMLDAILSGRKTPLRAYTSKIISVIERASTQDVRGGGRIVRIASEYIRLHLSEHIRTTDIARALNISARLVELRFRETLDCSVLERITSLRIEKAQQLMAKTDMTLSQIAFACGYSTPDGLKLAFKKRFGKTMSAWREENNYGAKGARVF